MKKKDLLNIHWEKMKLKKENKKLCKMAKNDPHWDYGYIFALERQKLICMRLQFSEKFGPLSKRQVDEINRWIDVCIRLLSYLQNDACCMVSEQQIERMNKRNLNGMVRADVLESFLATNDKSLKKTYGEIFYLKKMERLYYKIRLTYIELWWY